MKTGEQSRKIMASPISEEYVSMPAKAALYILLLYLSVFSEAISDAL